VNGTVGLKHYYRLGDKSGTSAADVKVTRPGTISGAVTLGVAGAITGDADTAFKFDGLSSGVEVPKCSASINGSKAVSLEMWTSIPAATKVYGHIAGFRNDVDINFYVLQLINQNKLEIRLKAGSASPMVSLYYNVSYDVWHHVVITYNETVFSLFVDGLPVARAAATGVITNGTAPLYIGTNALNHFFAGKVDEVSLYAVALTDAQVQTHFSLGKGVVPVGGVARSAVSSSAPNSVPLAAIVAPSVVGGVLLIAIIAAAVGYTRYKRQTANTDYHAM